MNKKIKDLRPVGDAAELIEIWGELLGEIAEEKSKDPRSTWLKARWSLDALEDISPARACELLIERLEDVYYGKSGEVVFGQRGKVGRPLKTKEDRAILAMYRLHARQGDPRGKLSAGKYAMDVVTQEFDIKEDRVQRLLTAANRRAEER